MVKVGCSHSVGVKGEEGGGRGRGMDSCWLSAVVCRKGYILHVTGKGNRYGSMSPPSVTGASHFHKDKKESQATETAARPQPAIVLKASG